MNCSPEEIALVAGHRCQPTDLVGDCAFLIERQRQCLAGSVELVSHRVYAGNFDTKVAVEQVLHEHHCMVSFLDRLAVKMLRQLRQVFAVEINRDRDILLCRCEFVMNLFLH